MRTMPDDKQTADSHRAAIVPATEMTELYVRIGRLERRISFLRGSLQAAAQQIDKLRQSHRASCPGCPLCLPDSPSPTQHRDDLDTSTDGRKLP